MSGEPADPVEVPEVPDRLRQRIVQLVADVLPALAPLPPALKRVADFAPARRARLGASAVWDALADDDFRARAGTQVAVRVGDDPDELDGAASAWLSRADEDWTDVVAEAVRRIAERDEQRQQASGEVDRLRAQVAALQVELRDQRAAARAPLEEAKAENTLLRRRLGETRAALRAAEVERDLARTEMEDALAGAAAATARAEAEAKRLREQLDEAAAGLSAARRDVRTDRDLATVRARYLLDTVLEAATGLRRELALPAAEGTPGDAVEAGLESPGDARTTSSPTGSPALDQMLSLPKARLVIDGYNVTKRAWGSATLEAQRSRLVAALAPLVARTGAETTVVFDAAASTTRTAMPAPRGVKVAFSPPGVIADDVVRQLVGAEPRGRVVVVVSDDQEVARDVRRAGARPVSADALLGLIGS